jgi:hypothetical protein
MRLRGRHLRLARAAFALFAALCLLASLGVGGRRYFYCPQMQEVELDACCPPPAAADDDGPAIDRAPCCAERHFATLGDAVAPRHVAPPPPAALVAVLPAAPVPDGLVLADMARRWSVARAGPEDPAPFGDVRLRSMVVLS